MNLRQATLDDAQGIATIVHATKELSSVHNRPIEVTIRVLQENLKRMDSTSGSTAYVIEADRRILGYCSVHWVPFLLFSGGEAYVTELFVHPTECGKGIGSRLLTNVIEEAKRRGCTRATLLNGRDSEAYHREFYKKQGWTERDAMANFIVSLK